MDDAVRAMRGFSSSLARSTSNRQQRRPNGRPRKPFHAKRKYRRVAQRHANHAARKKRGHNVVITIRTYENTPEWRWYRTLRHGDEEAWLNRDLDNKNPPSKMARLCLRKLVSDGNLDVTIAGLRKSLEARIRELEYRDAEIRELRHALGYHFAAIDEACDACKEVVD
jgi:hypothetical protein